MERASLGRTAVLSLMAIAAITLAIGCMPESGDDTTISSVNAQYCAFADDGKAYVSSYDSTGALAGLYSFSCSATSSGGADYLYMTDTYSGNVYTYDTSTHSASSTSLASTQMNATGEITFNKGIGYACVGSGTGAGVYQFDPMTTIPSFEKIVVYVPVSGTTGKNFQEIVIASDGYLYASNNDDGAVLRIDTSSDSVAATISASAGGTTGLTAGTYNGSAGVFVANTGGYDDSWNSLPGSIDFIAIGGATATTVASSLSGGGSIYPARLVQLSGGNLVATGYGHTYLIDLSGSTPSVTELYDESSSSFGSLDIAYSDGLVYIPEADYSGDADCLYVFDESGVFQSYSPVTGVVGATDALSNIGFYED